MDITTITYRH